MLYIIQVSNRDQWNFTKSLVEPLSVRRIATITSEVSVDDAKLETTERIPEKDEETDSNLEERFATLKTATHKKTVPVTELDRASRGS